ncbi:MAG: FixH family protein [Litoreibacter sp.]|nr:FixH family protein [Litoreibacter sp.]
MTERKLTGWHVLAIIGSGFAVIIGVNLTLAYNAVATFPGLETKNSYVASQSFDADRAAQDALRWTVSAEVADGILSVEIIGEDGRPVQAASIAATLGRSTHTGDDSSPEFRWSGTRFVAPAELAPGYWNLRLVMTAEDGTLFRRRIPLTVRETT